MAKKDEDFFDRIDGCATVIMWLVIGCVIAYITNMS